MNHFRRVLALLKPQYKSVILVLLCAFLTAGLFSLNIVAMLPMLKVMIREEGLHGWVHRSIVKSRYGLTFNPQRQLEDLSKSVEQSNPTQLQVISVSKDSVALETHLKLDDTVLKVWQQQQSCPTEKMTHSLMLKTLAHSEQDQQINLEIIHLNGTTEIITISPNAPPFYAPLAYKMLKQIPPENDPAFRRQAIIMMILLMLALTFLRCITRFFQQYLVKKVTFRTIMTMRMNAFGNAIRLPLTHFNEQGISDTMSRLIQDTNRISIGLTTAMGKLTREPFIIIALLITALILNAKMTLIAMTGAPIAAIMIGQLGKKMKKATKKTLQNWSKMLGRLQESMLGMRVIKGYHREVYEQEQFTNVNERLLKQQFRMAKIDAASGPVLEILGISAACGGMIAATYWITSGNMETTDFMVLVLMLASIAESGRKLGNVMPRLQTANTAAERVFELTDTPAEADSPNAIDLPPLANSIQFNDITFTYPESPIPTLQNININIKAGQEVAVVGPNGSGKTTLLSLIPRFFLLRIVRVLPGFSLRCRNRSGSLPRRR